MEDGLVQLKQRNHGKDYFKSLNPCCNGRWSRTNRTSRLQKRERSLNPCCSGRWSRTTIHARSLLDPKLVLILVVKENGLVR